MVSQSRREIFSSILTSRSIGVWLCLVAGLRGINVGVGEKVLIVFEERQSKNSGLNAEDPFLSNRYLNFMSQK